MSTIHKIQRYGWRRQLPDHRDICFMARPDLLSDLPPEKDLTPQCPAVYDQLQEGSCTANAIAAGHQFEQIKQDPVYAFMPSRNFIYWNERAIEDTTGSDAGASLRDGLKSINQQGVCPEYQWPYSPNTLFIAPDADCYTAALQHRVINYQSVPQSLDQMRGCLAAGYPFVFGFSVYQSFESAAVAASGNVPMPGLDESMIGGHAVLAVGYNDAEQSFIVRNSWGAGWGKQGYCWMPYAYLTDPDLASDFWKITLVAEPVSTFNQLPGGAA